MALEAAATLEEEGFLVLAETDKVWKQPGALCGMSDMAVLLATPKVLEDAHAVSVLHEAVLQDTPTLIIDPGKSGTEPLAVPPGAQHDPLRKLFATARRISPPPELDRLLGGDTHTARKAHKSLWRNVAREASAVSGRLKLEAMEAPANKPPKPKTKADPADNGETDGIFHRILTGL